MFPGDPHVCRMLNFLPGRLPNILGFSVHGLSCGRIHMYHGTSLKTRSRIQWSVSSIVCVLNATMNNVGGTSYLAYPCPFPCYPETDHFRTQAVGIHSYPAAGSPPLLRTKCIPFSTDLQSRESMFMPTSCLFAFELAPP